ncbi:MAG: glycine cleavage system protein GcvH [Candidatus Saganbacteria bacterium]|nr:glycine cleavage system protein GcvH [Candidatus Saganbacteria bacterium]
MYPEDLRYTREHEWARIEGKVATVGITYHAQDKLGDIVFIELPDKGAELKQAGEFGVVESVKTVSNLYSPLSGKVAEVNKTLLKSPELINEDPYGKGWIIKIKIADEKEIAKLLSSEEYQELIDA